MPAQTSLPSTADGTGWHRIPPGPSAKAWCQTLTAGLFQANHGGFSSGLGLELSHNLREANLAPVATLNLVDPVADYPNRME